MAATRKFHCLKAQDGGTVRYTCPPLMRIHHGFRGNGRCKAPACRKSRETPMEASLQKKAIGPEASASTNSTSDSDADQGVAAAAAAEPANWSDIAGQVVDGSPYGVHFVEAGRNPSTLTHAMCRSCSNNKCNAEVSCGTTSHSPPPPPPVESCVGPRSTISAHRLQDEPSATTGTGINTNNGPHLNGIGVASSNSPIGNAMRWCRRRKRTGKKNRQNRSAALLIMTISMMRYCKDLSPSLCRRCQRCRRSPKLVDIHHFLQPATSSFLCSRHDQDHYRASTNRIAPSRSASSSSSIVLLNNDVNVCREKCEQCQCHWISGLGSGALCDRSETDLHGVRLVNVASSFAGGRSGGDGGKTNYKPRRQSGAATSTSMIPPVLLMLHKDFIVTSPLEQNLLLTLALTKRAEEGWPTNQMMRRHLVLVGQFKAFASFFHLLLGPDAMRVRTESNAGGTSTVSESLSVEYFVRRFQAKDIVTEMEVEYCSLNWKKVDYICTLYGQRVGVSVTRAMSFPDPNAFSSEMACRLLYKKLFGLVVARHGVSKRHCFSRCILHVWCETQRTAGIMLREYDGVSRELDIADDVIMVLTVAEGWHAKPIFYESLLRTSTYSY